MADAFPGHGVSSLVAQESQFVAFPCFTNMQIVDGLSSGWQPGADQAFSSYAGAPCMMASDMVFGMAIAGRDFVEVTGTPGQHRNCCGMSHTAWAEASQQWRSTWEETLDFEFEGDNMTTPSGRHSRRRRRRARGHHELTGKGPHRAAGDGEDGDRPVPAVFCDQDFPPLSAARLPAARAVGERKGHSAEDDLVMVAHRCGSSGEETTSTEGVWSQETTSLEDHGARPLDIAMAGLRGAVALLDSADMCNEALARLAPGSPDNQRILDWVSPCAHKLALAQGSCRVVQRLLEVASASGRDELAERLSPWTVELYESPHGNHVLTKLIEVMPSSSLRPIVERIEEKGGLAVARHQFGCRVLERLIEHCTEKEMGRLNDSFVESAEPLCRHQYGNFVVQHLIEHGASHRGAEVLQRLLPTIAQLAMHRTASHVAQTALTYAGDEGQRAIAAGLLGAAAPHSLLDVAASRYGSYVVEDLHGLRCPGSQAILDEIRRRLVSAGPEQLATVHLQRVMARFGLALAH
mmetsp:Transcript_38720/g.111287  ORF Transcript_38720/g.111287 Transcript_38720/m.111287 type:complete len:521 (+) Transcript_38720:48-1610(+)